MTDSNKHEDPSYSQSVVLAVKTLLQKAREQKEFSLTFVGEDSILAAAAEHLEQELIQILMDPENYIKDAKTSSWSDISKDEKRANEENKWIEGEIKND